MMAAHHAKYIIFENGLVMVFPMRETHSCQAMMVSDWTKPISAGFIEWDNGMPFAHGYSYSLGNLRSRPEDSEIIAKYLGIEYGSFALNSLKEIDEIAREIEDTQMGHD